MEAGVIMDRDTARLEDQINALRTQTRDWQANMTRDMSELKTLVGQHPFLCPYRERIASIAELAKDLESTDEDVADLKKCVRDIERAIDRSGIVGGAAGGGAVAVIGGIVFGIGRGLGLW